MRELRIAATLGHFLLILGCGADSGTSGQELSDGATDLSDDAQRAMGPGEHSPGELQPVPEDPSAPEAIADATATSRCGPTAPLPRAPSPDVPPAGASTASPTTSSNAGTPPRDVAPPEPAPSAEPDVPAEVLMPQGVEFMAWEQFAMTNTLGPRAGLEALVAPLEVRSVSGASGYDGEDIVLAVRADGDDNVVVADGDDNVVVAVDVDALTFRNHWPHFPCGDCQVSSGPFGTALLTSDTVYGSTDGGYRYYDIAQGDFSDRATSYVRAVDDRIWVRGAAGWLGGAFDGSGELIAPIWGSRGVASVDHESGLEVTARYITRHAEDGQTSNTNVCAAVPDIAFGSAHHHGQFVVTLCDADTVWVFDAFPDQYSEFDLPDPVTWVGANVVATATGWYSVSAESRGQRVGDQALLAEGEHVFGHVVSGEVALRITSLGVAVSQLASTR